MSAQLCYFGSALVLMASGSSASDCRKGKPCGTVIGYICCAVLFFMNRNVCGSAGSCFKAAPIVTNEKCILFSYESGYVFCLRSGLFGAFQTAFLHQNRAEKITKHIVYVAASAVTSNASTLLAFVVMGGMSIALMTILGTSLGILITAFLSVVVFKERKLHLVDVISILCAIASVCGGRALIVKLSKIN